MANHLSQKRVAPTQVVIPDRLYFKIGDVGQICGLETYVLRFWESQFPQLKPNKGGTGQRLYRRRDVEMVLEIKRLVHDEGYTLAGARQALESITRRREPARPPEPEPAPRVARDLASVINSARAELREISTLLASPDPQPSPHSPAHSARRRSRFAPIPSDTQSLFPNT